MLVLTRKCQEVVVVGGANGLDRLLKITVLGIEKGKVRLGFEAPDDVPINRLEVLERIQTGPEINGSSENLNGSFYSDQPEPSFLFCNDSSPVLNAESLNLTSKGP